VTRGRLPVSLLSFVVLTFAWTWTMWWSAAANGLSVEEPPGSGLYLLGVFGPLVAAAWVVRRGGRAYRREFLRRIWDPRRIPTRWRLALVAVAAVPFALGGAAAMVTRAEITVPDYSVAAVVAVIMVALVASLAEEPGWRGAASDVWQARARPVWAALGIGTLWSLWHLPLHFFEDSWYHGMGMWSVRSWLVHLLLVQLGVLFVWLANGSGGSVLVAVLAHAGVNVAVGLVPESVTRDLVAFVSVTLATVAVIAATRGQLAFTAVSKDELAPPGAQAPPVGASPPPTAGRA